MTERKHSFTIKPYGYTVELVVSDNIKESRKSYDKFLGVKYTSELDVTALHSYCLNSADSVIFLPFKANVGLIAHECFHCVARIYRLYDCKLNTNSEEIYAYTLDYIVSEVYAFVKGAKK